MTMDFESLDDFFVISEFAETCLFGNDEVPILCIYDEPHYLIDGTTPDITTSKPMLTCQTSLVADYEQDDPVIVRGRDYIILDKQPDGTGISEIILKEA